MTEVFRVKILNRSMADQPNELYFETKDVAEKFVTAINSIAIKEIEWECEVIEVHSAEDILQQLKENS